LFNSAAECLLGEKIGDIHVAKDAGEVLAEQLIHYMKETGMPNGLSGVDFTEQDIPTLVEGAWPQVRIYIFVHINTSYSYLHCIHKLQY
jgi:alcohol dehydrogenase class IV